MDWGTFLVIYIIALVITIILVAAKKTHWGSIIGVAIIPIYFIWVLIDAFQSSAPEAEKPTTEPPVEANKKDSK